ncbi:MAG: winged helix DNA-binding protein [Propionibacteriaceae bacterium]|nr:winged helix DNA-binding protein [Propionibacteriaceae bacterium]
MRNLYRYTRVYSGQEPELIEGDVFTTIIPLGRSMPSDGTEHGIEDVTVTTQKLLDSERSVLEALRSDGSMTIKTLVEATGLSQRQVSRILVSLREYGLLRREGSDRSGKWVVLTSLR